jgi:WD40 repeat protein
MFELCRLSNQVVSTAIRPGGNWVAIGGWRGGVEIWELSTRRRIAHLAPGEYFAHAAFSPDGSRLAFSTIEWLRVWDCATREIIAEVQVDPPGGDASDRNIKSICFSAAGETIVTFQKNSAIDQ